METPAASKRSSQRTAFVNVSFVLCAKCGPPRFYIIFFFFLEGLKGEESLVRIDSILGMLVTSGIGSVRF